MRPLKVILLVIGSVLALVGIGSLIGGLVLGWAYGTQRDAGEYFPTRTEELPPTLMRSRPTDSSSSSTRTSRGGDDRGGEFRLEVAAPSAARSKKTALS